MIELIHDTLRYRELIWALAIQNYAIFLLSVLLPWNFFSQSLSYGVECIAR